MATSRGKRPAPCPTVPTLRDLTSLRSQLKRSSPSPVFQVPSIASTEEKLRTVTNEWTHIKRELQRRALVSKSANVSMSESSSLSISQTQGKKLVEVLKASSSPEPSLRSPRREILTGRSGNILFKKKTVSPVHTDRRHEDEKTLTKAMQCAASVSQMTKNVGNKPASALTFMPSPQPRIRSPLLQSHASGLRRKRSLLTAGQS